ncbi:MAG TPA: APC family permease [Desulfobacteria bacterium]|nr:APC family permease [Desulfobacteria bacterium]
MAVASSKLIWLKLRTLIFGHPLTTQSAEHHKVGILGGIPIFGSDVISSEGYAPDEILYVLGGIGAVGYAAIEEVSLTIVVLLLSILMVYRKAIQKYPQGGGSYTIAQAYLGEYFGLLAGAGLSLDYILTVAVSISSAIDNLSGVFPWLIPHKVIADCILIAFMTVVNLRGFKESARLFAIPVYLYIASIIVLVGFGLYKVIVFGATPVHAVAPLATTGNGLTWFLFARAVAGGTTALTGIEAVSNGVTAFKQPAQKKAISVLFVLGIIVAIGLGGMSFLASKYHLVPTADNTIMNQLGLIVFGKTVMYYLLIFCAAIILMIAANTPFVGLPILLSLMARDGYAPRYFKNLGDRLVYSAGIWTLSVISLFLIIIFQGDTHLMLPLYAIGVLVCFSLTGIGLAKHVFQTKQKGWINDFVIFAFGGVVSCIVSVVFLITKFEQGAWVVVLILPALILFFRAVSRVYRSEISNVKANATDIEEFNQEVDKIAQRRESVDIKEFNSKIIVPVFDINRIVLKAMLYGYELTPLVTAVHIASDLERAEKLKRKWKDYGIKIELRIVESPYRATVHDLLHFLDEEELDPSFHTITLAIPEYVPEKVWQNFLHNQTGQLMKFLLLLRKNIYVTSIPFHPRTH